jgi:carboxyl-terminal processing protease
LPSRCSLALWPCLVVASIFLIGLGLGYGIARWTGDIGSGSVQVGGGQARRELRDEIGIFWEALDLVYRDYYGELPDDQDAAYGAIRGVLNQLDDPNTSFMEPDRPSSFARA